MNDRYHIVSFLKFGRQEHMLEFLQNGIIYMNPLSYFKNIEDNNLRGDNYEGVHQIWNPPAGKFKIPALNHEGNYLSMHLKESYENTLGNILSLYCISSYGFETPKDFHIDERIKDFGSHCVLIKDIPEFLSRIESQLNLSGLKYNKNFVEYYDKNDINGHITVFQKPSEFEYQKEFRFYIERNDILPLILKIGDLRDIAEIFSAKDIFELQLIAKG